jgi:hypothetical protein
MFTIEERLKVKQKREYEWLQQHRSKLTVFFLWIDEKLDPIVKKLLEVLH